MHLGYTKIKMDANILFKLRRKEPNEEKGNVTQKEEEDERENGRMGTAEEVQDEEVAERDGMRRGME